MNLSEFKNTINKVKNKHDSLTIKITKKELDEIQPNYFENVRKIIIDSIDESNKKEVEDEKWNCLYLEIVPKYQDVFYNLSTEDMNNDGGFMFRKGLDEVSEEELEILNTLFNNDKFYYKPKKWYEFL